MLFYFSFLFFHFLMLSLGLPFSTVHVSALFGYSFPLQLLINAIVEKASGFGDEYSNIPLAYDFLCSVVTLGVSEAGIMVLKAVGGFCTVPICPIWTVSQSPPPFGRVRLNKMSCWNVTSHTSECNYRFVWIIILLFWYLMILGWHSFLYFVLLYTQCPLTTALH